MHTIPLNILVEARSALKAVKDLPVSASVPHHVWAAVDHVHNELHVHVELLLKHQTARVNLVAAAA